MLVVFAVALLFEYRSCAEVVVVLSLILVTITRYLCNTIYGASRGGTINNIV